MAKPDLQQIGAVDYVSQQLNGSSEAFTHFLTNAARIVDQTGMAHFLLPHVLLLLNNSDPEQLIADLEYLAKVVQYPAHTTLRPNENRPETYVSLPILYLYLYWNDSQNNQVAIRDSVPQELKLPRPRQATLVHRPLEEMRVEDYEGEPIPFLLTNEEEYVLFLALRRIEHADTLSLQETNPDQLELHYLLTVLWVQILDQTNTIDTAYNPQVLKAICSLDSRQIKNLIARCNIGLVNTFAARYLKKTKGMLFDDLVQEGNIGLLRAIDKFDLTRGFTFATYASYWIRQSISRAIKEKGHPIRKPEGMVKTIGKMYKIIQDYLRTHHREPTIDEIAQHMNRKPETIEYWLTISKFFISLQQPFGSSPDADTLEDVIADDKPDVPSEAERNILSEKLHKAFQKLFAMPNGPKLCHVLIELWGLPRSLSPDPLPTIFGAIEPNPSKRLKRQHDGLELHRSYTDIAKDLNITSERVRQLEREAYQKLRVIFIQLRMYQTVDDAVILSEESVG